MVGKKGKHNGGEGVKSGYMAGVFALLFFFFYNVFLLETIFERREREGKGRGAGLRGPKLFYHLALLHMYGGYLVGGKRCVA